jgi:hypothetical protein
MAELREIYLAIVLAEHEAEHAALEVSDELRHKFRWEKGKFTGHPTAAELDAETKVWRRVDELRQERREWVERQK